MSVENLHLITCVLGLKESQIFAYADENQWLEHISQKSEVLDCKLYFGDLGDAVLRAKLDKMQMIRIIDIRSLSPKGLKITIEYGGKNLLEEKLKKVKEKGENGKNAGAEGDRNKGTG